MLWLQDMPNGDRIYKLMMDIYIVRAMKCFALEEDMYAKLLFIMRSRELAIKLSRVYKNPYDPDIIFQRTKAIES